MPYVEEKQTGMIRKSMALLAAGVALCVLMACSPRLELVWEPEGGTYVTDDLQELLEDADLGSASSVDAADAPALRKDLLVDLRAQGEDASFVADLLTTGFPPDAAALPMRIEGANVNDTETWLVFEAWGETTGLLSHRRLWVFDRKNGNVIQALSKR